MAYRITTTDSHKLVLERDAIGCTTSIFVGAGCLFLAIGVGLNVFMDSWEFSYILFRVLFPAFGAMAILAGLYLPRQIRNTMPEQITFDHAKGAVIIEMTKNGTETGYIGYDEIEGFDIFREKSGSYSSSSGNTANYYTYHIFLKKKDGGEWFLTKATTPDRGDALLNIFRTQVPLNRPSTITASAKLSDKISKQEGAEKTVIHWQNHVSLWTPLFLVIFSVAFFSILSSVLMGTTSELGFFFYGVVGFILLVYAMVMFSVVRNLIKDSSTRYAVAVSHTQFEYYEFSKSTGVMKNQKTLLIHDVDRIVYSFAPNRTTLNSSLSVLTQADATHWQQTRENPLAALKDIFTDQNKPITLSITALNPVECLQLENWLQNLVLKKSDKKVT